MALPCDGAATLDSSSAWRTGGAQELRLPGKVTSTTHFEFSPAQVRPLPRPVSALILAIPCTVSYPCFHIAIPVFCPLLWRLVAATGGGDFLHISLSVGASSV
jgi:hypothetical protein